MSDYVIQRGETLSRIARAHCTDVQTLLELNPQIKNQNLIFKNDTIQVPDRKMDTFERRAVSEERGALEEAVSEEPSPVEGVVSEEEPAAIYTGEEQAPIQAGTNPFLYAAGGAAAGVVGMRLAEKAAPAAKHLASKAVAATKTATTKAIAASKTITGQAATATQSATRTAVDASKTAMTKLKDGTKALLTSGKAKITQGAQKLSGKVSSAKVAATKAAKTAGAAAKSAATKLGTAAKSVAGKAASVASKVAKSPITKVAGKLVGRLAAPIAVAAEVYNVADAYEKGGTKAAAQQVKKSAKVLGCMATGAAIGSVVPVIGTGMGAFVGGIVGMFI